MRPLLVVGASTLAVGIIAIAGCADDPGGNPATTPSATASSASPSPTSPTPSPTPPAGFADPATAIAAYLDGRGVPYAGDCAEEPAPGDVGSYCSTVTADRGDELVVKIGLVQSEYDTYLLLQRTDGSWLVVDSADYPDPDDGTLPF